MKDIEKTEKTPARNRSNKKEILPSEKTAKKIKISASEKAIKKANEKVKKEPKSFPAKKLPKILKKKYLPKAFTKQIEKKLFIEHDRKFVLSYFKENQDYKNKKVTCIPLDQEIPKDDFERLKKLGKQIASQKGAVKFVPLLATVCAIVLVCVLFMLFRNILIKKVLVNSMQNIFKAKTEIAYVNLDLFANNETLAAHGINAESLGNTKTALLQLKGLQQADKDSENVMKNLFEIDEITFALNFTELLRGKFIAQKIAVNGVAIGTQRTSSGFIPGLTDKKEEKNTFLADKRDEILNAAEEELKKILESYNPQTLLTEIQDELQSPKTAKAIAEDVQLKIEKWKNKPAEIETKVKDVTASVTAVTKVNWGGINDFSKIKKALETLKACEKEIKSARTLVEKTAKDMEADTKIVNSYAAKIQNSINSDKNLVTKKVNEMKAKLSPAGFQKIMSNAIEGMLYSILGNYYPMISNIMDFAINTSKSFGISLPENSKSATSDNSKKQEEEKNAEQKEEKSSRKRMEGRTVIYRRNKYPGFLIQDIQASGKKFHHEDKELFHGYAKDISSNQILWEKPTTGKVYFDVLGHDNNANIVIDARDNSKPLLSINYEGNKYPISADAKIFDMSTKSDIKAEFSADSHGEWKIGGSIGMDVTQMKGMDFEPEQVCRIYKNALSKVRHLDIGYALSYSKKEKLKLEIKKLDALALQLSTPVVQALQEEILSIAAQAKDNVMKLVKEKTASAESSITKYKDIEKSINSKQTDLKNIEKDRQKTILDLEKKLTKKLLPF